ncbi:MAG: glycosyltransferase family 39 protein [Oscillospiraceae bacterium]|nr:glycosyltransferase family 39 protein [Oscillospiraceae bacterium]
MDHYIELGILDSNMKVYAEVLFGKDSSLYQSIPSSQDIRTSIERDHGESALYLMWPFFHAMRLTLESYFRPAELLTFFYYHLVFLFALYALYQTVRSLTGSPLGGLAAMLLLYCNPRFWGESFYNNKDMVLLSLCLIVFWRGLRFIEEDSWSSCIWFGLAGAFAFNTRLLGLGAFGVCGIAYLADLTVHKLWDRKKFLRGLLAVGSMLFFFFLLTPAAWSDPLEFFVYLYQNTTSFDLSRWNGPILYRGAYYNPEINPIPWHYIPWLIVITTPPLILILAVLTPLAMLASSRFSDSPILCRQNLFCACLALFSILPILVSMLGNSNLYNGWRHMYFTYGPIVVLAAYTAVHLCRQRIRWLRLLVVGLLSANLIYYSGFIARYYPHEYAYFNFLAGEHPEESYEADYWLISLRPVLLELLERDTRCTVTNMGCNAYLQKQWYNMVHYPVEIAEDEEEVYWDRRGRAVYVVENTSYWQMEQLHNTWVEDGVYDSMQDWIRLVGESEVVYEVKCGRTVLWRVYKNPQYNGPPVEW